MNLASISNIVAASYGEQLVSRATIETFLFQLMADRKVPRTSKCVATVLLLKFINSETGQCSPSGVDIARATSFTNKTVYAALEDLKHAGWITIEGPERRGTRRRNNYVFHFDRVKPASPAARVPA